MRSAFHEFVESWAAAGHAPETAQMEEDYEAQDFPVEEFLRRFLGCTDTVPKAFRQTLAQITETEAEPFSYAEAAHELLLLNVLVKRCEGGGS